MKVYKVEYIIPDAADDYYADTVTICYSLEEGRSSFNIINKIKDSVIYGTSHLGDQCIDVEKTESNLHELGLYEIDIEDTIVMNVPERSW